VIREERPGVDDERPLLGQPGDPGDEVRPVGVVADEGRPLDPPHHHVVQGPGGIEAGMARHGTVTIAHADTDCRVPYYTITRTAVFIVAASVAGDGAISGRLCRSTALPG
jgi:hypothetical protein